MTDSIGNYSLPPQAKCTSHWRWVKLMTLSTALLGSVACVPPFLLPTGDKAAPVANALPQPPKQEPPAQASAPPTADSTAAPPVTATVAPPAPPDPGPFSPSKILQVGSRGEAVLALEKRLAGLRYDVGAVDGSYYIACLRLYRGLRGGNYAIHRDIACKGDYIHVIAVDTDKLGAVKVKDVGV